MEALLIHATLTVSGDPSLLTAADARIQQLFASGMFDSGYETHHGDQALAYDFKVRGGIPFPVFAQLTLEFPVLVVTAEWVNMAAGVKGRARLAGGRMVEHEEAAAHRGDAAARNRYVRIGPDGRLLLAIALQRRGAREWAGYVLKHDGDALFHLVCLDAGIELRATEGAPEWSLVWRLRDRDDTPPCKPAMAVAVDRALYAELDRLAREFVDEWIWMDDAPAVDTAIEREHCARHGHAVHAANLRAVKRKALRNADDDSAMLMHDTLDPDDRWIRDVLLRCWAGR